MLALTGPAASNSTDPTPADSAAGRTPYFARLTRRSLGAAGASCAGLDILASSVESTRARTQQAVQFLTDFPGAKPIGVIRSLEVRVQRLTAITRYIRSIIREDDPLIPVNSRDFRKWEALLADADLHQLQGIKRDLSDLAHDVNNMLAVAQGNVSLLTFQNKPDQLRARVDAVSSALDRIKNMVAETLALLNKEALSKQSVSGVPSVLHTIQQQMESRLEMEVTVDPSISGSDEEVGLAQGQCTRLLFDLIDNAQKAGATRVQAHVTKEGAQLLIALKDNGPGFKGVAPLEASKRSRRRSAANGNGLPLCFDFCQRAGGSLTLVDPDAVGATWHIRLPARQKNDAR